MATPPLDLYATSEWADALGRPAKRGNNKPLDEQFESDFFAPGAIIKKSKNDESDEDYAKRVRAFWSEEIKLIKADDQATTLAVAQTAWWSTFCLAMHFDLWREAALLETLVNTIKKSLAAFRSYLLPKSTALLQAAAKRAVEQGKINPLFSTLVTAIVPITVDGQQAAFAALFQRDAPVTEAELKALSGPLSPSPIIPPSSPRPQISVPPPQVSVPQTTGKPSAKRDIGRSQAEDAEVAQKAAAAADLERAQILQENPNIAVDWADAGIIDSAARWILKRLAAIDTKNGLEFKNRSGTAIKAWDVPETKSRYIEEVLKFRKSAGGAVATSVFQTFWNELRTLYISSNMVAGASQAAIDAEVARRKKEFQTAYDTMKVGASIDDALGIKPISDEIASEPTTSTTEEPAEEPAAEPATKLEPPPDPSPSNKSVAPEASDASCF